MKNVPDELLPALRGAVGDLPNPGPNRWGKSTFLHLQKVGDEAARPSLTVIATGALREITPMAVSLKFSMDGRTFTPDVPAEFTGEVNVDVVQMIDVKTGAFRESFQLVAGDVQPFCSVMCMALQVIVTITADDASMFLYVHAVAAPTTTMDCRDIVGPGGGGDTTSTPAALPTAAVTRQGTSISPFTAVAEPRRGYFLITNQSTLANLFIALGDSVDTTPGSELASIILPPNSFAGYEIPQRYTGPITIVWDAEDADGYALLTQGLYPA